MCGALITLYIKIIGWLQEPNEKLKISIPAMPFANDKY